MKYLILALLPLSLFGQAPKKANTIVAQSVSLKDCVAALVAGGYQIEKIDTVFNLVLTKPKAIRKTNATIVLQVSGKDDDLLITGTMDPNTEVNGGGFSFKGSASRVENIGMKGSDAKLAFEEMDRFAKSLDAELKYLTR